MFIDSKAVGLSALAVCGLTAMSAGAGKRVVVDRIAAVIEGEIVTVREVEKKALPFLDELAEIEDKQERRERRKEVLRKVLDIEISEKLVKMEIDRSKDKLGVTSQDVDRAIDEVLRLNNLSREQLQAALYGQGLTWSEYRKQLRDQIQRARLIQFKVQGKVQISDKAVEKRCVARKAGGATGEKVCAAHILFKIPPGTDAGGLDRLRARVSKLQAELRAGADFAAYALKHSEDSAAPPDGDLGCFARGEMVQAFEKAAYASKVGEVSKVVRTKFGFHIIRVYERRSAATQCESEEDLTPFKNEIYQEELERQMKNWIDELRKKAFVEIRL